MRPARILLLLSLIAPAGCGAQAAAPAPSVFRDVKHGFTVQIPPGWQRAVVSLTPHLADPREMLSAGTFPLRYRDEGCAHNPSSALADLGPGDALVTVQERGIDPRSNWPDFPPRPAHFGPDHYGQSEAAACVPGNHFADYWFGFTDGGRHFHVLVAFGLQVSPVVREQAWRMLDSLEIDPAVKPGWTSAG